MLSQALARANFLNSYLSRAESTLATLNFSFITTEAESYALFLSVPYYLAIMIYVQNKFLKLLKTKKSKTRFIKVRQRKLEFKALFFLAFGIPIHMFWYWLLFDKFPLSYGRIPEWRTEYLIWTVVIYIGFCLATKLNFYLKGTTALPQQDGQVSGLP